MPTIVSEQNRSVVSRIQRRRCGAFSLKGTKLDGARRDITACIASAGTALVVGGSALLITSMRLEKLLSSSDSLVF